MHLQADTSLAEAPGFSTELLESIEAKKKKLEDDIDAYIETKKRELWQYEQELLAQYRETECGQTRESATSPSPSVQSNESTAAVERGRAEEKEKRTKHTRVHKREKELFGLATIFLPLLEMTAEATPTKKKESQKPQTVGGMDERVMALLPNTEAGTPSCDAAQQGKERRSRSNKKGERTEHAEISYGDVAKDKRRADSVKKAKRPAMKKSALRSSGEKGRRKRVSLVIDDQIVLPADHIPEPLTSPSDAGPSVTSSASSSITSLDETIDPRLMQQREEDPRHEHQDPVHHSIPLPAPLPSSSPTKHTGHTLPDSSRTPSPQSIPESNQIDLNYEPPSTTGRTVIDPPAEAKPSRYMPQHASSNPIYASAPERKLQSEEDFSSYVGGISGSGVDDFDQTGSLGFPSSLGASYMESYMQNRPLSVRMAAAEKAGDEEEKAQVAKNRAARERKRVEEARKMQDVEDEDMDVIGSMEDF